MSDKVLGGAMLLIAAFVFSYYTVWALFLVSTASRSQRRDPVGRVE
jgi:dolichyl-phosphate mannosyltransferase polypeptide 2 regulatory subunit